MAFDLGLEELEEIEEDDEELGLELALDCAKCGEPIHLTEEIFIFKIVRPIIDRSLGQVHFYETDSTGALLEEAAVHCFHCWEETNEEATIACEDVPPVTHPDGLCTCDNCGSDINEGETMGIATYGEVHWSARCPNGEPEHAFESIGDDKHICIVCIRNMDLDHIRVDYAEHLAVREALPNETCSVGLSERCWRHNTCTNHCHRK